MRQPAGFSATCSTPRTPGQIFWKLEIAIAGQDNIEFAWQSKALELALQSSSGWPWRGPSYLSFLEHQLLDNTLIVPNP